MKRWAAAIVLILPFLFGVCGGGGGDEGNGQAGPVERGSYNYGVLAILGIDAVVDAGYHPDGSYLLIADAAGAVYAVDAASRAYSTFDPAGAGETILWADVAFDPTGSYALLTGYSAIGATVQGTVRRFSDAAWKTGSGDPFTSYAGLPSADSFQAVGWPGSGGDPVLLGMTDISSNWLLSLNTLDAAAGSTSNLANQLSPAGCQDLAFVQDQFGDEGILVVCGINGSSAYVYEPLFGLRGVGDAGMGNVSRTDSHTGGDYSLVVDWGGRRLYRFDGTQFNTAAEAPTFAAYGIYGVTFNGDGSRALVYGRAGGTPLQAPVIEYRHGSYSCPTPFSDCELTDVSIPGFDQPPYNATSNMVLFNAAWSPVCDGGVIAAGDESVSTGLVLTFDLVGGTNCW